MTSAASWTVATSVNRGSARVDQRVHLREELPARGRGRPIARRHRPTSSPVARGRARRSGPCYPAVLPLVAQDPGGAQPVRAGPRPGPLVGGVEPRLLGLGVVARRSRPGGREPVFSARSSAALAGIRAQPVTEQQRPPPPGLTDLAHVHVGHPAGVARAVQPLGPGACRPCRCRATPPAAAGSRRRESLDARSPGRRRRRGTRPRPAGRRRPWRPGRAPRCSRCGRP